MGKHIRLTDEAYKELSILKATESFSTLSEAITECIKTFKEKNKEVKSED